MSTENLGRPGSYTSQRRSPSQQAKEVWNLYHWHAAGTRQRVVKTLAVVRDVEAMIHERYGVTLKGQTVLDVGSGHQLIQLAYFASANKAIGIDLDVITWGFDPRSYLRMLQVNGARRTAKTIGRKLIGLDARYAAALRKELGLKRLPRLDVRQMDVTQLEFPDNSFDLVYSSSVFQHLPDPGRALDEIARVLRPSGVGYLTLQLWTSETGSLDVRILGGRREEIPAWAHLRADHSDSVIGNAYLNRRRLLDWETLFSEHWPGSTTDRSQPDKLALEANANALRAAGELSDYSNDELLTHELRVAWQKPK